MSYIYEGLGLPKIVLNTGTEYVLPEPVGSNKDGLRIYDFETMQRDGYWSEGGSDIAIGKKYIFSAALQWISMSKTALKYLWIAQKQSDFKFILNEDKGDIYFQCKVTGLKFRFMGGIPNHPAGYSVQLNLKGTKLLNSPGYDAVLAATGWGTNWGGAAENQ